jgi:hypothetical protein
MHGRSYLAGLMDGVRDGGARSRSSGCRPPRRPAPRQPQAARQDGRAGSEGAARERHGPCPRGRLRARRGRHAQRIPGLTSASSSPGQLAFADAGKPEEVVSFEAGSVGFREAKVTHLARNPGKTPMKVIEVEVK